MQEIRAGVRATVRPVADIATTLDSTGALSGLPFMPETLPFACRTLRVAQLTRRTCVHVRLTTMFGRLATRIVLRRMAPGGPGAESGRLGRDASWGARHGEWVRSKSRQEIESTMDDTGRLNGLGFGGGMAVDCGKTPQVQQRVLRILDERTGRIRDVRDAVILEGSVCDRCLGCAGGMPILWREAWPERVEDRDGAACTA
jgi:hypothetical protein